MRSKFIIGVLLVCTVMGVYAQEAVMKELTGTVELKPAGSAVWEKAVLGQSIAGNTVVSTGFKSYALISIGGSVLNVRPLTRLTVTELSASATTETINVSLQAGRVKAEVKPPSGGMRTSMNVQTPIATASVRGTIFEVDTYELKVIEGTVEFSGASGTPVVVDAGGDSYIDEKTGRVAPPMDTLLTTLKPDLPVAFDTFESFMGATAQPKGIEIVSELDFSSPR